MAFRVKREQDQKGFELRMARSGKPENKRFERLDSKTWQGSIKHANCARITTCMCHLAE